MDTHKETFGITSSTLHVVAMLLMLCDHVCMTILGNQQWLHYVGRLAFPIFAFMLVEGFRHTGNVKKYLLRLLIFALISEIPFDLMTGGVWFFPTQQNVLWTFIIAIVCMLALEQPKKLQKPVVKYIVFAVVALFTLMIGFLVGIITMVDYFGGGIVVVLVFYFFRGDEILSFRVNYAKAGLRTAVIWFNRAMQAILLWNICSEMLGGLCTNITLFGTTYEVVVESFAIFSLIPIWLYNGRKGEDSKLFRYLCYSFYPAHITVLILLQTIIYR